MNKIKKHLLPVTALILISVISHRAWLNPNNILTNGDVWFLYKDAMKTFFEGTWTSFLSLGDVNVSYNLFFLTLLWRIIAFLGGNYQIANQITYFFIIIFITPIAIYIYLFTLTKNFLSTFLGSLVYMFSTIFLILQLGGLLQAVVYSFLPLIFLYFEKFVKNKKMIDGLLLVFFMSISVLYELRITYITCVILLGYGIFILKQDDNKHFFKSFVTLVVMLLPLLTLFLLINAYNYFPFIFNHSIQESAGQVTGRSLFGADFYSIKNPLVLMHPFWTGKEPSEFISEPMPFYFWVFPLFAFSALFFIKRNRKILAFAVIALLMVFLGKSASDPFGSIYTWLYYNFPGFDFFREPSKFWVMLTFSYTVLIAFTLMFLQDKVANKKWGKSKKILLNMIIISPLLIVLFYVSKPAFTSQLRRLFTPVTVTADHFYLKKFLTNQQNIFRTLYLPGRYRLGFWSEIHPMIGLNEIQPNLQGLDPRLLSILGVKYVIIPPDITNDVYRIWGKKEIYQRSAMQAANLKKINDSKFGSFSVYKNTLPYKSRIYLPTELDYVVGDPSNMLDLLSLTDISDPTFYFQSPDYSGPDITLKKNSELENTQNYASSSRVFLTASCIRCEDKNYHVGMIYPFARLLPSSPLYGFIIAREQKKLSSLQNDMPARLQLSVFYGTKRMVEIQKITDSRLSQQISEASLIEYKRLLEETERDTSFLDEHSLDNDTLLYIYDYLEVQKEIANTYLTNNTLSGKNIILLQEDYKKLMSIMGRVNQKIWKSDKNHGRYFLKVSHEGFYDIFIHSNLGLTTSITIDDQKLSLQAAKQGWLSAGKYHLTEGTHKITLEGNNLILNSPELNFPINGKGLQKVEIPLDNIESNVSYEIAFTYKITNANSVRFFLNRDSDFEQNGVIIKTLDQYLKADENFHEFNGSFTTRFGEKKAILTFNVDNGLGQFSNLNIENLKVKKNKGSLVVFKENKSPANVFSDPPRLTFQWINPTKYYVHVANAKSPFYLAMDEDYHGGWEAFYSKENNIKNQPIIANYQNGKVKEILQKNDIGFSDISRIFMGARKKIPEHFAINSYANAWYVDKPGTYDIEIEFNPQIIFLFSLIVSGLAFLVGFIWLVVLFFHEK